MTEIAPTTAASVLANQLAASSTPVQSPGLPAALPVQIIALPPEFSRLAPQNLQNLVGDLQLQLNGQAVLQTSAGAVTLTLPQVRGNPALLQAIKHYLGEHRSVTLQLQTTQNAGLPAALLLFAPMAAGAGRTAEQPETSTFNGHALSALVLPADRVDRQSTAPMLSSVPPGSRTETFASDPRFEPKLEAWLRQWLGSAVTKTNNTQQPDIGSGQLPLQRLMEAAKALQTPLGVIAQQFVPPGHATRALRADEVLARVLRPAAADGALLVNVGEVNLLLKTSQAVPAGGQLILKLLPPRPAAAEPELAAAAHDWPTLQALLSGWQAGTLPPSGAWQSFIQHRVPRPDSALAGALLAMLGAMRQHDPRAWLGKDNSAALEQGGRKSVLEVLQQELRQHSGTTTDAAVGDWRVYQLPLLDQQHILPLQIYVHHNPQRQTGEGQTTTGASQERARQTRFVIDVTFSRLGAMQFDGFVNSQQFDLVLRTIEPLAPELQHELQAAFRSATLATGYQGQMIFQTGRQHWLQLSPQVHGSTQV